METRYVRIARFTELTGYSDDAVRAKIQAGDWLEGREFRKAPDGRILMDLQGYERWVEHQHATAASAPRRRRQSRSTSTGVANVAANG